MKHLININYKNLIRSKWLPFFYGINTFTFIFYIVILNFFKNATLINFLNVTLYRQIIVFVLCFFVSVSIFFNIGEIEISYPISKSKLAISKYLSVLIFSIYYIIIDLIFVLTSGVIFSYSFSYLINIIIEIIIVDFCFINLSIILGFLSASIIKTKYCYLTVFLYLYFFSPIFQKNYLYNFFSARTVIALQNLLNTFKDNIYNYVYSSFGILMDKIYILDKTFIILLSIIFLIIFIFIFSKRKKYLLFLIIFFILLSVNVDIYINNYYSYHNYNNSSTAINLNNLTDLNNNIDISSISMDMKIDNIFENKCNLKLINNTDKKEKTIKFYLDPIFNIDNITLNGNKLNFTRNNDVLTIYNADIMPHEFRELKINYSSNLKEIINPGVLLNFSSEKSSNLLIGLKWYPIFKLDKDINYSLNIDHNNKLITNLNNFKLMDNGKNKIAGTEKYLYISTGFFKEFKISNKTVISGEEISTNIHKYTNIINYYEENTNKKFTKIVIAPSDTYYRDNKDYLIIGEDSIWQIF